MPITFSLQIFAGNFDRNSIVRHELLPPFHANLVKIHPVSYCGWISMRIELYGCPIKVRRTCIWLKNLIARNSVVHIKHITRKNL